MLFEQLIEQAKEVEGATSADEFLYLFSRCFDIPKAALRQSEIRQFKASTTGQMVGHQFYFLPVKSQLLRAEWQILKINAVHKLNVNFVIIANDDEVFAVDLKTQEERSFKIASFHRHVDFFLPIIGRPRNSISIAEAASVETGEHLAQLFRELAILNPAEPQLEIGKFLLDLTLTAFLDVAGVLTPKLDLSHQIDVRSAENGVDFGTILCALFSKIESEQACTTALFPDINTLGYKSQCGNLEAFTFNKSTRALVLQILNTDWSEVEPETLGALLQQLEISGASPSRRYYTRAEDIEKVLTPLVFGDLYKRFENCHTVDCFLRLRQEVLALQFFDPSCGSGNYLVAAFKMANILLQKIAEASNRAADTLELNALKGLDSNEFAAATARLSIGIARLQAGPLTNLALQEALAFVNGNNIECRDPLDTEWETFLDLEKNVHLIGSPPMKGKGRLSEAERLSRESAFSNFNGSFKELDFAASWFWKAAEFIHAHGGAAGFMTTNSLTQGVQVARFWPAIFQKGVAISFAYTTFKFRNEAKNQSTVAVTIIGLRRSNEIQVRELHKKDRIEFPKFIGGYLTASSVIVKPQNRPIGQLPKMVKGNMPYQAGELLLDRSEYEAMTSADSRTRKYIKRVVGSDEIINAKERWCIWLPDTKSAESAKAIPLINERIKAVERKRKENPDPTVQKLAPHRFREVNETHFISLVVPNVSSEKRVYHPVDFVGRETIVTNLAAVVYDCDPWVFAVVASRMHNVWYRAVCGEHETRNRYSHNLGYNTFPFPNINDERKKSLRKRVNEIIRARELYCDIPLGDLYKEHLMPAELEFAHYMLDLEIDQCFRPAAFLTDEDRLEFLMKKYEELIHA